MKIFVRTAVPLLIAGGAIGCAADISSDAENFGENSQEILNGTNVATDTWGSPNYGCSATLLRDRWVLTARHCGPTAGTSIQLLNGQTAQLTNPIYLHPTMDVAVARLSAPLTPSGAATTNGPFPLYRGSESQLLNQTVYCQGWGANSCTSTTCSGYNTLRSANISIDLVDTGGCVFSTAGSTECYRLTRTNNQLAAPGDSGGGCLLTNANTQKNKLTGVQSSWDGSNKNWQVAAPSIRDWVNGIIGAAPSVGPLAGFERGDLVSSVTYRNSSNHIVELAIGANNWGRTDLTTFVGDVNAASDPSAFVRHDGVSSIVFRSTDNHIREIALPHGGNWVKSDLTAVTGAAAAAGDPVAFGRSDLVASVIYRGTDSRIRELSLSGGTWAVSDLLTLTGGALASSDPVAYVRADGTNSIVYRSSDNHIRELTLPLGGAWQAWDITAASSAVNATGRPRPYTRSDGVSSVLYRSSDNHIREIALVGGAWVASDLTALAGAPVSATEPFGYVRSDGVSAVVFKGSDNRIRELSLSGATWTSSDLLTASGGPLADGTGLSAFVRADRANVVLYRTSNNNVQELSLAKGSGTWAHSNLTSIVGGAI